MPPRTLAFNNKHEIHAHPLGLEHFGRVSDEGVSLEAAPSRDTAPATIDAAPKGGNRDGGAEQLRVGEAGVAVVPTSILEALLFVGNGPVSPNDAAKLMRVGVEQVEELVRQLDEAYEQQGRPYRIVASADGYRLELSRQYDRIEERLHHRSRAVRISPAAVEVLALIAYRQPIHRQSVENLRGADCGGILRQLVRRGLLRIERPGSASRDVLYRTTERFLEVFCLGDLDELPRAEDLQAL